MLQAVAQAAPMLEGVIAGAVVTQLVNYVLVLTRLSRFSTRLEVVEAKLDSIGEFQLKRKP